MRNHKRYLGKAVEWCGSLVAIGAVLLLGRPTESLANSEGNGRSQGNGPSANTSDHSLDVRGGANPNVLHSEEVVGWRFNRYFPPPDDPDGDDRPPRPE